MLTDEIYMHRCIELARLATGNVAPNPMVGAVLVHEDKIIGEGFHQKFGEAHAEVNCINSVREEHKHLILSSTLYVSLEPCSHSGKTPPCSDLIIQNKIPRVVVGCQDPFALVNGKGIEKLKKVGVNVKIDVLKSDCINRNKRFFTYHQKKRPYIILKWAQTANGMLASESSPENSSHKRLLITNDFTNRIVHKWRSEESAILVGTNTALLDNPQLNNRYWSGNNPVRLVIDFHSRLPSFLKLFNNEATTIVFNTAKHSKEFESLFGYEELRESKKVLFYKLEENKKNLREIVNSCYRLSVQSIIVEGGATLLQSFIDENLWDEARIITKSALYISKGLASPKLNHPAHVNQQTVMDDCIDYFINSVAYPFDMA